MTKTGGRGAMCDMWFPRQQITDRAKNVGVRQGIAPPCVSSESNRVEASSFLRVQALLFYGFDISRMLKEL